MKYKLGPTKAKQQNAHEKAQTVKQQRWQKTKKGPRFETKNTNPQKTNKKRNKTMMNLYETVPTSQKRRKTMMNLDESTPWNPKETEQKPKINKIESRTPKTNNRRKPKRNTTKTAMGEYLGEGRCPELHKKSKVKAGVYWKTPHGLRLKTDV